MNKSRTIILAISLALGLGFPAQSATPPTPAPFADPASATTVPAAIAEVEGNGLWSFLGCVGCVVSGAAIAATGGVGGLLIAASYPGSALAVASCIGTCAETIFG